ncbi:MAG TPA: IS1595 family transposase [Acidobacteriaceae bacterium]|jgi:transposase-like protein|nr:IS1595 family transposase [Acidobacteriaceae bacterium]
MKDRKKQRQSIPGNQKYTFQDFNTEFPDDDACLRFIAEQKWPDCRTLCEKCGVERKHYPVTGRKAYACDHCGNHIYPMAGTIFEKSTTRLRTWFHAMYLMGQTRCGISAKQIQRETGVTYKTAWRMFKQIRILMAEDIRLEGSSVELDEMYVGGKDKNKHVGKRMDSGRPGKDSPKTPVFGMVERGGRVIARVTPDVKAKTLFPIIKECVLPASTVYTDEYPVYGWMKMHEHGYVHHRVQHQQNVYVMGDAHTNSIEGFWSLVKRGIGGVYHSVSRKYLQSYLDEYAFRYNRRDDSQPMFVSLLEQVRDKAN